MIDKSSRIELARSLRLLIDGEMTNDQFDDLYIDGWSHSEDLAVAKIARFGWSLYSDWAQSKLSGKYAVNEETRRVAERAIHFLHTDLEYEWPRDSWPPVPFWVPFGPGFYLVIGVCLLVGSLGHGRITASSMVVVGLLAISPSLVWLATQLRGIASAESSAETIDFRIWPFRQIADSRTSVESNTRAT